MIQVCHDGMFILLARIRNHSVSSVRCERMECRLHSYYRHGIDVPKGACARVSNIMYFNGLEDTHERVWVHILLAWGREAGVLQMVSFSFG